MRTAKVHGLRLAGTFGAGLLAALTSLAGDARACGGSGPGGTGGCELRRDGPRETRVSASVVATDTTMLFGSGRRAEMQRAAAFATLGLPLSRRVTFEASLGATLGTTLKTNAGTTHELGPGAASALGITARALSEEGLAPFVIVGLTLSSGTASGKGAAGFSAYDLRASVIVGKTFAEVVTPYVLARGFGGPAFWRWDDGARVQGTDLHKFQIGAGLSVAAGPVDLFAEGVPLGERSLAGGAGIRF